LEFGTAFWGGGLGVFGGGGSFAFFDQILRDLKGVV
jgi:hypothetical protein